MDLTPPRGTDDLLPPVSQRLLALEMAAHEEAKLFGYQYVETPAFEHTALFARTSGESSDIVTKEMYTFEDKGGRSLTLRPEGTAPVVRAYLQRRHELPSPFKAYYVGSMWRHGRPQAGRLREFRQFGVEVIGSDAPSIDAEVILVADRYLRAGGLGQLTLLVNSIGDEACRPAYRERLVGFLEGHREELCRDCRERIGTNPLRTFDCKQEGCRKVMGEAPVIADHLCGECEAHFAAVRESLTEEGVEFTVDPSLVRGLDYYTRTAFEHVSGVLSTAQATVCGGGRYDGLAEVLGGTPTPGMGFGLGLERVMLAMQEEGLPAAVLRGPACFVVTLGPAAAAAGRELARALRAAGIAATGGFEERPLKAQLRMADRSGASYAGIIGEREVAEKTATMRRLSDGEQTTVALSEVAGWISERV